MARLNDEFAFISSHLKYLRNYTSFSKRFIQSTFSPWWYHIPLLNWMLSALMYIFDKSSYDWQALHVCSYVVQVSEQLNSSTFPFLSRNSLDQSRSKWGKNIKYPKDFSLHIWKKMTNCRDNRGINPINREEVSFPKSVFFLPEYLSRGPFHSSSSRGREEEEEDVSSEKKTKKPEKSTTR